MGFAQIAPGSRTRIWKKDQKNGLLWEFRNSENKDEIYQKILSNMEEVKARGGNIIAIINEDDSAISKLAKHIIKVPKTSDILSPIINVIPLQLLAYHVADLKGLNVDRPRNLAKSVTVE